MGEPRPGGTAFIITVNVNLLATNINYFNKLPTFEIIAGVNPGKVQWVGPRTKGTAFMSMHGIALNCDLNLRA